jgi:hypothetical protein
MLVPLLAVFPDPIDLVALNSFGRESGPGTDLQAPDDENLSEPRGRGETS